MSDAEHLIENVLHAMASGKDAGDVLQYDYNQAMLIRTGIREDDLLAMAQHVVYGLYDGRLPEFPD